MAADNQTEELAHTTKLAQRVWKFGGGVFAASFAGAQAQIPGWSWAFMGAAAVGAAAFCGGGLFLLLDGREAISRSNKKREIVKRGWWLFVATAGFAAVDTRLASKSKSLRSQSLAILLMQRDQVRLDLLEELKGDRTMEQWIRSNGRSVAYKFHEREATQNCISLAAGHKCPGPYMIAIDGLNIRIIDPAHHLTGTFALQPDNSLCGTILVKRAARPVAAKIELEK